MAKKAHPGFAAVAKAISKKGGYSMKAAGAILAKKTRNASPAAKAANPRLNRVAMPHEGGRKSKRMASRVSSRGGR